MSKSKLQKEIRNLAHKVFPYAVIEEELYLGKGLYLDILIRRPGHVDIGIEVQGEQHYKPNKFFHKTTEGWHNQKRNDRLKKDLCLQKNIVLVEYGYFEPQNKQTLLDKINEAFDSFN